MDIINKFDLFIFDLDDTIVKTEKLHYNAWIETLRFFYDPNYDIDFNFFCLKFHSIKENSIKSFISEELKLNNYEEIISYKNKAYLDIINQNINNIELIEGLEKFINKILINNKQFVIVSNSPKIHLDYYSNLFPILKNSSKNYYREILINKKPNPECYLKVVEDFPNMKMIGFEDSITGIHSITQVDNIELIYFINTKDYYYYEYIINNYKVIQINNYLEI